MVNKMRESEGTGGEIGVQKKFSSILSYLHGHARMRVGARVRERRSKWRGSA